MGQTEKQEEEEKSMEGNREQRESWYENLLHISY